MSSLGTAGRILEILSVVLAGSIAVVGFRAYLRAGATMFRRASFGFGLIAVGLASESVVMHWTTGTLSEAHFAESLFLLGGLGVLYLSLTLDPGPEGR